MRTIPIQLFRHMESTKKGEKRSLTGHTIPAMSKKMAKFARYYRATIFRTRVSQPI